MTTDLDRLDSEARSRALDTHGSFVVQAPAGSGKTTLLTERLLALLAVVDTPESILAITFTRKAAAEMRARVIEALRSAAAATEPAEEHRSKTWRLARAALARSAERGWSLESQPARLSIETIDALSQSLAAALPILSRAGAALDVEPDAGLLYDEATLRLLAELGEGGAIENDLATLLTHLDNDYDSLRGLLADLLGKREHWFAVLPDEASESGWRERLEAGLVRIVEETLQGVQGATPADVLEELWKSAIGAAGRWPEPDEAMQALGRLNGPRAASAEALPDWQTLCRFVLLNDNKALRKDVNVRNGFPPTHKSQKLRHKALLERLAEVPDGLQAWGDVAHLPGTRYADADWRIVSALLRILKRLLAHLRVVFTERGRVDYTEVAMSAREALGRPEEPTDLALRLDYRIEHILVDEFQDTSLGQVELLRRLTAGWTGTDGRTLFCVGDPMQSIYRFRQADVALFLRVQRHGIESLRPETLTLARNFRSQAGVVDWVNRAFAVALPDRNDFARGAVRYTPVQPTRAPGRTPAVRVWPSIGLDEEGEASAVVAVVQEARARVPDARIAVLARTRSHLQATARRLRASGLAFEAVDFEELGERRAVRDLAALTRAICHRDDRIAWYAILRSPFCGLTLEDLALLESAAAQRCVVDGLSDLTVRNLLSTEAQAILARVLPVLLGALDKFGRWPLAMVIEAAWLELGGPASVEAAADLENARVFFERLAREERAGDLEDPERLDEALNELYAASDAGAGERLQLLTIHKAKGLEWDVVIVPGLGRKPRGDRGRLLHAVEVEHADGAASLVLAPGRPSAAHPGPLEKYARRVEGERASLENARLMYVAATRARAELHLLGHATLSGAGDAQQLKALRGTLLQALWPAIQDAFSTAAPVAASPGPTAPVPLELRSLLRRLPPDWRAPALGAPAATVERATDERQSRPDFDWASEVARHVGVIVHRELDRRVRARLAGAADSGIDARLHEAELRELGVPPDRLPEAAARVRRAVEQMLEDERGRWILGAHAVESSEWALTADVGGEWRRLIVDRSFIDADGTRWIIDYKTSLHEGSDVDAFLANEVERYRPQLARYAEVASRFGSETVRAGLYFPLLRAWREVDLAPAAR